jgi:nucleotide-binding universal stress UspA family protein
MNWLVKQSTFDVGLKGERSMFSNILVATDGSDTANRAVDHAADLAARLGVPLTVGHVLQHGASTQELERLAEVEHLVRHVAAQPSFDFANAPTNMDAVLSGSLSGAEKQRVIAVIGDEIVDRASMRAKAAGAQDVSARVVNGDYDEGILGMAKEIEADTIVIGQRGLGRLRQILQGSVSQKVIQQAECAVIVVR